MSLLMFEQHFLKRVSGAGSCGFGHNYWRNKSVMENFIYGTVTI